uniref:Kynureninase n=1 Tax=Neogobius melanostomus TaxID=47308 RepID=A0A8C6U7B0_9GOBI
MEQFEGLTPTQTVERVGALLGCPPSSAQVAQYLDLQDPLRPLRDEFLLPRVSQLPPSDQSVADGSADCIYLVGNSLGLQPRLARQYLEEELDKWAQTGVHGHTEGCRPWAWAENNIEQMMADIVGANREEVALMNGLTVNLHLLLLSFYKPTASRHKILLEAKAFPSDHVSTYTAHTYLHCSSFKVLFHIVKKQKGEETLRTEDILDVIEREGESIAVVMFPGIQYYTGQLFDMAAITAAGHRKGCYVGFDCAHAAGNALLQLHDWEVDFACWCSYKYLNSGPGGLAGAFIHDKHKDTIKPALTGWWGHDVNTRFQMNNVLDLQPGVSGFRLLEVFHKAGMAALRRKSVLLTGYLEYLIRLHYTRDPSQPQRAHVAILTPTDPQQRGCQLSLCFSRPIHRVFQELEKRGVACDMREPSVLRVAPVPLYNSFSDVHRFIETLGAALRASSS